MVGGSRILASITGVITLKDSLSPVGLGGRLFSKLMPTKVIKEDNLVFPTHRADIAPPEKCPSIC